MNSVVLNNVWKSFGDITAVKGLNLEAEDGKPAVILGPSGAGKTTTLRLIAGLESADEGEILLGGKVANELLPYERDLAMTFESYALYPHMTVFGNIASPLYAPGKKKDYTDDELKKRVEETAELLGIGELLNRMPRELSGGQRQRVALGRTLIKGPKLFLFDEPIAHLDAKLRHRMRGEMKKIFTSLKSAVIYTTHDYIEASSIGDKVVVINMGENQQTGTPGEIFSYPVNDFVFSLTCEPVPNFFNCNLVKKDNKYSLEGKDLTYHVDESFAKKVSSARKEEIKIGIRPNDITVSRNRSDVTSVRAEVYTYEFLGTKLNVTLKIGSLTMEAEMRDVTSIKIGQEVWIGFDTARMFAFDKSTGGNLLPRG